MDFGFTLCEANHNFAYFPVPQAATSTRAASASTSRAVATNPPSPEVQITGFRRIRVRLPASPEFISTGHHFRRPQLVSPSTIRCRLPFPVLSSPPRAPPIRHSIRKYGARVRQVPPVMHENLLQGDGLRPAYNVLEEHHHCGLCSGVKIHPVSYVPCSFFLVQHRITSGFFQLHVRT